MAERFGGPHSPESGSPGSQRAMPSRAEKRCSWLYGFASLFALKAFFLDPFGLALNLAAFAMLVLAAWLTREGVRAADAYRARQSARRPAFPRKIAGALATAIGLGLGAYSDGGGTVALLLGLIGGALHLAAFGPDPLRDKGMENIDPRQQDRVARIIAEGEAYLAEMDGAARSIGDRRLTARIARFALTARDLFHTIEEDPRDLTAARRYLGVYLMGARDATVKFAQIWAKTRDGDARADYEALLDDLENNFAERTKVLLRDNRVDLDIEIGVLRDRLKRDGLPAAVLDGN
ncbi:MAG: 5-bromo-4-chloroindolyl phosphate hydrolysis family protein [Rhodobacteraceae bacterium]|nr:5-bromo-4-chloroindolyl phosphate hydrolysis family protein [Paracoccaceae bacterium]